MSSAYTLLAVAALLGIATGPAPPLVSVLVDNGAQKITARLDEDGAAIVALSVTLSFASAPPIEHGADGMSACQVDPSAQKAGWFHTDDSAGFTRVILYDPLEKDEIPNGPLFACTLDAEIDQLPACVVEASDSDANPILSNCHIAPAPSATPSSTATLTPTSTLTPTPTFSPTNTPTAQATSRPMDTATPTPTNSSTPSATPQTVHLDIGMARGRPGQTVEIVVSLRTAGLRVSATSNEIEFDPPSIALVGCGLETGFGRSLVVNFVRSGAIRIFVQPESSVEPIEDGPLYSCRFEIGVSALPGTVGLTNLNVLAFDASGTQLEQTDGANGSVLVSLVPLRGDANRNGRIEASDLRELEEAIFSPAPPTEADVTSDGLVTAADLTSLLLQLAIP